MVPVSITLQLGGLVTVQGYVASFLPLAESSFCDRLGQLSNISRDENKRWEAVQRWKRPWLAEGR